MNPALPSPDASRLIVGAITSALAVSLIAAVIYAAIASAWDCFMEWPKRRSARIVAKAFPEAYDLAPMGAAGRKDDVALQLLDRHTASRADAIRIAAMRKIADDAHDAMLAEQALARFDRRQSAQVPVPDVLLEAASECENEPEQDVA